jgi:predicted DNA-binding antitoxin AbrB/MazE fold protein
MRSIEAIFTGGVFRPLGQVSVAENERVRLPIETCRDGADAKPIAIEL